MPVVCLGLVTRLKILPPSEGHLDGDDDGGHSLHQQARQWFHHPVHLTTPRLPHPQKTPQPGWRLSLRETGEKVEISFPKQCSLLNIR